MMIRACCRLSAARSCAEFSSIFTITPGVWSKEVDGVLQLPVQHHPVGDDDDLVEDRLVLAQPGLSRPRRPSSPCVVGRVQPGELCASHAMVFDLPDPAECWTS